MNSVSMRCRNAKTGLEPKESPTDKTASVTEVANSLFLRPNVAQNSKKLSSKKIELLRKKHKSLRFRTIAKPVSLKLYGQMQRKIVKRSFSERLMANAAERALLLKKLRFFKKNHLSQVALEAENNKLKKTIAKIAECLICPISRELVIDPILAEDGHSYERDLIETWLQTHNKSPMTNKRMATKVLYPNHTLKSIASVLRESGVSD